MPGLQFYATPTDLADVLRFIFEENDLQVFETYSIPERPLRQFRGTLEVFDALHGTVDLGLHLYADSMNGRTEVERFALKPNPRTGTAKWREQISGWGLIQLHLCTAHKGRLDASFTGHNTLSRAVTMIEPHAWLSQCAQRLRRPGQ